MNLPATFEALVSEATQLDLYENLIGQLNKDLLLANIDVQFDKGITPEHLKSKLHETIFTLIQERFSEYLNLLYIIDVPEDKVKAIEGNDMMDISEGVAFLVLLREWQKVWIKKNYG